MTTQLTICVNHFLVGFPLSIAEYPTMVRKTKKPKKIQTPNLLPFGQRLADAVANLVGSWKFIIGQTLMIWIWIAINMSALGWDSYPFVLLNLVLAFLASYTGPIIIMSQNRQSEIDRATLQKDYEVSKAAADKLALMTKTLKDLEEDRSKQLKLLTEILEEMDPDEEDEPGACPAPTAE
jgi:uncharacterized membrane protein